MSIVFWDQYQFQTHDTEAYVSWNPVVLRWSVETERGGDLILTKATVDTLLTPPPFSLILCVMMDHPIFKVLNLHKLAQFHSLPLT